MGFDNVNVNVSGPVQPTSTYKTKVLKGNHSFASQVTEPNMKYVIKHDFTLTGDVIVPANCVLEFDGGSISANGNNDTITGNNTTIIGTPSFTGIILSGSFTNKEWHSSWCKDVNHLSYLSSIMNTTDDGVLVLDENVNLSGDNVYVEHLHIKGNGFIITNCAEIGVINGDTDVSDCTFLYNYARNFEKTRSIIRYGESVHETNEIHISLKNVNVDGNQYISQVVRFRRYEGDDVPPADLSDVVTNPVVIEINGCDFKNLNFAVADVHTRVTGRICDNTVKHIGWEKASGDTGMYSANVFRFGYDWEEGTENILAHEVIVENNDIRNIVGTYSNENDGHELHAVLIYGHDCVIRNNHIENISASFNSIVDAGMDTEAIYVKGVNTLVEGNYIRNGAGSNSDAVINLKHGLYHDNSAIGNTIVFDSTFSCICFRMSGDNIRIERNTVDIAINGVYSTNVFYAAAPSTEQKIGIIIKDNNIKVSRTPAQGESFASQYKFAYLTIGNKVHIENNTAVGCIPGRFGSYSVIIGNLFDNYNIDGYSDETNTENMVDTFFLSTAELRNNRVFLRHVNVKNFINVANTICDSNYFEFEESVIESILRGTGSISMNDNTFKFGNNVTLTRKKVYGENSKNNDAIVLNNTVIGMVFNSSLAGVTDWGTTTDRPTSIGYAGFRYFDTTLNKPVYWTGSTWIDATGTTV